MKERKSDLVRRLVAGHEYKRALAVAKGFRIGICRDDQVQMTRASECLNYPAFYQSIGFDPDEEIAKGIEIIKKLYGKEKAR